MLRACHVFVLPFVLFAAVVVFSCFHPVTSQAAPDPVEELRDLYANRPSVEDVAAFKIWQQSVANKIAELQSVSELQRGLELLNVQSNDRAQIAKRLTSRLEAIVRHGTPAGQRGAAVLIGEMGAQIVDPNPNENRGYARSLTPLLGILAQNPDLQVRVAALEALGKVLPDANEAAPVLQNVISSPASKMVERRAAAQALGELISRANKYRKSPITRGAQGKILPSYEYLLATAEKVIPAIQSGFRIDDSATQQISSRSIKETTEAVRDFLDDPNLRQLTKREEVLLKSIAIALNQFLLSNEFAEAITAKDLNVTINMRRMLEFVGEARSKYFERRKTGILKGFPEEPLLTGLDKAVKLSLPGMSAPVIPVRQTTIDFLEWVPDRAVPAVSSLNARIKDPIPFIRWSAGRVLGRIGKRYIEDKTANELGSTNVLPTIVGALSQLVVDRDLDVRRDAGVRLRELAYTAYTAGNEKKNAAVPIIKSAVPQMIKGASFGDREPRITILEALQVVGVDQAAAVAKALLPILNNPDAGVRKAAAETIGSFGPPASTPETIAVLERLLQDRNNEVREAAGGALLDLQK